MQFDPASMYRRIIIRHFDNIPYFGIIANIDFVVTHAQDMHAKLMYLIIYQDKDSEHISQEQITEYLVLEAMIPDVIRTCLYTLVAASCDKY
jgi:hypothetical protein